VKAPKRHSRRIRAAHDYRVHAIWWRGQPRVDQIGLVIQRAPTGRPIQLRPGAGLPAWLTRAQAKRLRDALSEALR
jgi:hypothetical protein